MFSNQDRLICSINMWPTAHLFIAREQKWPQPLTETLPPSGRADMIFISNKRGRGRGQGTGDGGGDGWGRKQGVKDSPREKHSNKCRIPTDDNEPGQTA